MRVGYRNIGFRICNIRLGVVNRRDDGSLREGYRAANSPVQARQSSWREGSVAAMVVYLPQYKDDQIAQVGGVGLQAGVYKK
ncbi:uncharacterized protein PG986_006239 [Apiospora aurea]|uniref:Uncharacterized protein n=1 Tax=Apiospora aurea TaxID=335848 RepID=A0ABR1QJU4_9PEZI